LRLLVVVVLSVGLKHCRDMQFLNPSGSCEFVDTGSDAMQDCLYSGQVDHLVCGVRPIARRAAG